MNWRAISPGLATTGDAIYQEGVDDDIIIHMIPDVILHCGITIDVLANVREDLIPRPARL
jgi:hypothetical protein